MSIHSQNRIHSLDTIRGVAVLGILLMNIVSFGLTPSAYLNISTGGMYGPTDWTIGVFGEIFADQKFMGIFSLLFGSSIVLFTNRVEEKGVHTIWLSVWRGMLLLFIGFIHSLFWEGDVLILYAICTPFLLLFRKRTTRILFVIGSLCMLIGPLVFFFTQSTIGQNGEGLGFFGYPTAMNQRYLTACGFVLCLITLPAHWV